MNEKVETLEEFIDHLIKGTDLEFNNEELWYDSCATKTDSIEQMKFNWDNCVYRVKNEYKYFDSSLDDKYSDAAAVWLEITESYTDGKIVEIKQLWDDKWTKVCSLENAFFVLVERGKSSFRIKEK